MPDIKVRVGQTNAVKVVASAFGGSLTAENAQNAVNVLGGIASVTQLYNSGITTFLSNLYVAGITTLAASGGITTTGGDFYVGGDLYINDDVVLDEVTARNVNVSGTTTTTNLLVTGIATIGGATVNAGAFENIKVTGISTLSGPVGLGSNLNVAGISTFNDDIQFPGAAYNILWDKATSKFKFDDSAQLVFGSASGGDMKLFHQSGNSTIRNETGQFRIAGNDIRLQTQNHSEDYLLADDGGSVSIFYNDVKRLETTGLGVTVFGTTQTQTLNVSGVSTFTGAIDANGQIIAAETSNQIPFVYTNYSNLPVDPDNGLFAQVTERGKAFYSHNSNWYELVNKEVNGTIGVGTERYNIGPTNVTTLNVSGIATFASDVSIGGTLTYEDVTNVDSIGLITARSGVRITSGGLVVNAGVSTFTGIVTTTSDLYVGGDLYISDDITFDEFTAVNGNITGILTAATANVTGTLTAGLIDGGSF